MTGICSLSHGGRTLRFRTNPNSILWTYNLNTKVEETYGGRVVQILSCNVDELIVTADCGLGGMEYMYEVAIFFRNLLIDQKNDGEPAVFEYTGRNWILKCFATAFPFKDSVTEVVREFEMRFKVQEDVSGVLTEAALTEEITRLQEGIGFARGKYNDPEFGIEDKKLQGTVGESTQGPRIGDPETGGGTRTPRPDVGGGRF